MPLCDADHHRLAIAAVGPEGTGVMANRVRVLAFAAAAAAVLVAPILTASPALASRPAINPASCAEDGGVFSRNQGTRICIIPTSIRYQTFNNEWAAQPVPGLFATWTRIVGQQESLMKTQKGNGPVQTATVVSGGPYVSIEITNKTCEFDDGVETLPVAVSQCEDAEMYPLGY